MLWLCSIAFLVFKRNISIGGWTICMQNFAYLVSCAYVLPIDALLLHAQTMLQITSLTPDSKIPQKSGQQVSHKSLTFMAKMTLSECWLWACQKSGHKWSHESLTPNSLSYANLFFTNMVNLWPKWPFSKS